MKAEHFQKKYWSPNSPFTGSCVFSARETASFMSRNVAELMPLEKAMAALTRNLEPKRWRATWLIEKFASMGMPKRLAADGLVLIFLPDFVASVRRQSFDESVAVMQYKLYDNMVDAQRGSKGRVGLGIWTSKPSGVSKVAGAPAFKTRHMEIKFRTEQEP